MATPLNSILEESTQLSKVSGLMAAIDFLRPHEKRTRLAEDVWSNTQIVLYAIGFCINSSNFQALVQLLPELSSKQGYLKEAIISMAETVVDLAERTPPNVQTQYNGGQVFLKDLLLETICAITQGKIHFETLKVKSTLLLSESYRERGLLEKWTQTLCNLHIETFESIRMTGKISFILKQISSSLALNDFETADSCSKKIAQKVVDDIVQPEDIHLKISFYNYRILICCRKDKFEQCMPLSIKLLDAVPPLSGDYIHALMYAVLYSILSSDSKEKHEHIDKISRNKALDQIPLYKMMLEGFQSKELLRWSQLLSLYGASLRELELFSPKAVGGEKRLELLKWRTVEHNIRVISTSYSRITLSRLSFMLDVGEDETEKYLSDYASNGCSFIKIDRPKGIVEFRRKRESPVVLSQWFDDIDKLMRHVVHSNHLIDKLEERHALNLSNKQDA